MRLLSSSDASRPRMLVINPNSTEAFSRSMQALTSTCPLDFYTAPASAPASIEGTSDSIITAAACLAELKDSLDRWDGYVVACFSAHPLTHALREHTAAPVVSILEAPLLLASTLGAHVGILTTSPRWVPLLTHDVASLGLAPQCAAGVVSSAMSVLDLERLPRAQVLDTLGAAARDELVRARQADVVVLGCAGMVGLAEHVADACGEGVTVLDPVACGVELCASLMRLKAKTSKVGMYAQA